MNIIFGHESAERLSTKYTILELDTFLFKDNPEPSTAFCVIETVPIEEMPLNLEMSELHKDMIEAYKEKKWDDCLQCIESLYGFWSGEVNSFYDDIKRRIAEFTETPPAEDWTALIVK
jgi:hypothetical protein